MNATVEQNKQVDLPAPVARRGITEAQWRTLDQLFPGAKGDSKLMVWDYCVARKLDPMKKPCHIVPMQVKNQDGDYVWRDVVMPGIYEYRTTATRTGLYLGHSEPEYGPEVDFLGVQAPAWCKIIAYRWNTAAQQRAEYPVRIKFVECCGTAKDKKTGDMYVNGRWSKAPEQMLTKCTEAAALREAFPDELGGTHTVEEMAGQAIDVDPAQGIKTDPRGDTSSVDWEKRDEWVCKITDMINADKDEYDIADQLRTFDLQMQRDQPMYIQVLDKLASEGIVSKINWRKWLSVIRPPEDQTPAAFREGR